MIKSENDPMGQAMWDYYQGKTTAQVIVHSSLTDEDDIIPASYLFRSYQELPEREKYAIDHVRGRVLDIGAGSGCHALILAEKGVEVTPIDISPGAVSLMKERGIKNAQQVNIFDFKGEKYDTILMLMNGIGITGSLGGLGRFLQHAATLLNPQGQILLESADIIYMFEEEDGSVWLNLAGAYYGECTYQMEYKGITGEEFNWLYIDFSTLEEHAEKNGFKCELLLEGDDNNYLARLTPARQ